MPNYNQSLKITIITALISAFLSHRFTLEQAKKAFELEANKQVILETIDNIYSYRTPFTIDYESLEKVNYSNYRCPDPFLTFEYTPMYKTKVGTPDLHDTCWARDNITKMRTDFKRKTIRTSIFGSKKVEEALNEVQIGFIEVLDYYLGHEYYMRAFPDAYMEVMPEKIDNLVEVLSEEIHN